MPRIKLAEAKRWTGEWWLPDGSAREPGTLTYSPTEGLVLELIRGWEYRKSVELIPGVSVHQGYKRDWELAHGLAGGERFTLRGLQMLDVTQHPDDTFSDMKLRADVALVGEHVLDGAADHVTRVRFEVENLSPLIAVSGITSNWNLGSDGRAPDGSGSVVMEVVAALDIQTKVGRLRLEHWYDLPRAKATKGAFVGTLAESVFTDIYPLEPVTLDGAFELGTSLRQLVSLASMEDCALIAVQVELPQAKRGLPEGHPQAASLAVLDVLFRQSNTPKPSDDAARAHEFVFTTAQVTPETFIPAWFELYETQSSALELLVDVLAGSSQSISARVLAAVSSAEAYHAGLALDPPMQDEQYEELSAFIVASAPEEHRDWVKSRFPRNDYSLRQRLDFLASELAPELRDALHLDIREWKQGASEARNKVAHTGNTGQTDASVLIAVTEVTAAVVLLHVLEALGMPKAASLELFDTNPRFRRTAAASRRLLSRKTASGRAKASQLPPGSSL